MTRIFTILAALCVVPALSMCKKDEALTDSEHLGRTEPSASGVALPEGASNAIGNVASCRSLLHDRPQQWERAERTREVLGANVHWQGAPHQVFPKRISVQSDIDAAFGMMDVIDVPILVSLIGSGNLSGGEHGLAGGVLSRFGTVALPCIKAGISVYRNQRASDLSAIKINIEVEFLDNTANGSSRPG